MWINVNVNKVTIFIHWRSIAEQGGCFQQRLFVSLFVNTTTSEWLNVGWWNLVVKYIVQKSRPSLNMEVKGQGHRGQKNVLSTAETPQVHMNGMRLL